MKEPKIIKKLDKIIKHKVEISVIGTFIFLLVVAISNEYINGSSNYI